MIKVTLKRQNAKGRVNDDNLSNWSKYLFNFVNASFRWKILFSLSKFYTNLILWVDF